MDAVGREGDPFRARPLPMKHATESTKNTIPIDKIPRTPATAKQTPAIAEQSRSGASSAEHSTEHREQSSDRRREPNRDEQLRHGQVNTRPPAQHSLPWELASPIAGTVALICAGTYGRSGSASRQIWAALSDWRMSPGCRAACVEATMSRALDVVALRAEVEVGAAASRTRPAPKCAATRN